MAMTQEVAGEKPEAGRAAALVQARRWWGNHACVQHVPDAHDGVCRVGIIFLGFFMVRGRADTWALAFQRATVAGLGPVALEGVVS